jgi:hypothetical protein
LNEGTIVPKHSTPSNETETNLPAPTIIGVLPPVPGGEENLLPKDAWLCPLRVEFAWWDDPSPIPGRFDVVQLVWDDDEANPVAEKRYDGSDPPVMPADLWMEVPVSNLGAGVHTLYYKLFPWNGSIPKPSIVVNVTIDKTAPVLAPDSKLIFPPEVLPPNKLTAHYLEGDDQLLAGIPAYASPKPGDLVTLFWDPSSSGTTVGGTKVLTAQDYDKPLTLTIPGQWIRDSGDGDRYIWYTVTDRAGNPPNGQSAVVKLDVAAQPIPRVLPPPKVVEAGGATWPVRGTLNPLDATDGVSVILNPASVIYPDEVPRVQWAQEGVLGAYLADPISPGAWEYKIPKEYMAPHFGKVIPVVYLFKDKLDKDHLSQVYSLTVSNYPNDRLPTPQCAEGSPLSFALVPATGASITLAKWPFSAAGQRITILVEGIEESSGKTIKYGVLEAHEVTSAQAIAGITRGEALVAKADFLSRIRLGSTLVVKVYVRYDNSQTPPNPAVPQFIWFKPRLIA